MRSKLKLIITDSDFPCSVATTDKPFTPYYFPCFDIETVAECRHHPAVRKRVLLSKKLNGVKIRLSKKSMREKDSTDSSSV